MLGSEITFANVHFFWGMLLIPILVTVYILHSKKNTALLQFSAKKDIPTGSSYKVWLRHGVFVLNMLALAAFITALARPQSATSGQNVSTEGIDIVIALDISSSMLARDFKPNRLEASKDVAQEFIDARINDRIGLVVYAGESFTQCPLTTDHAVLKNLFQELENGLITDGTAIGMGLATAVNRLKDSEAKSKVVILLSDGSNNAGDIPPITAAEIAETMGVRVYTIGVGTNGMAPMPFKVNGQTIYENVQVFIDEETLSEIANKTGGKYFRATDKDSLSEVYEQIDQLEKSIIEVTEFRKRNEEYLAWILIGLALLGLRFLIQHTVIKSLT
jgi:Ca-activated chloride channel family protein